MKHNFCLIAEHLGFVKHISNKINVIILIRGYILILDQVEEKKVVCTLKSVLTDLN